MHWFSDAPSAVLYHIQSITFQEDICTLHPSHLLHSKASCCSFSHLCLPIALNLLHCKGHESTAIILDGLHSFICIDHHTLRKRYPHSRRYPLHVPFIVHIYMVEPRAMKAGAWFDCSRKIRAYHTTKKDGSASIKQLIKGLDTVSQKCCLVH